MTATGKAKVAYLEERGLYVRRVPLHGMPDPVLMGFSSITGNEPRIVLDEDGAGVLAWSNGEQIVGRHFGKNGSPTGEVLVLAEPDPFWYLFDIAMVGSGEFITVWEDYPHVSARRFGPDGQPAGPVFQVSDTLVGIEPQISVNTAGEFVVTWFGVQVPGILNLYARRYDSNAQSLGPGFQVNRTELDGSHVRISDVALNDAGTFVIGWDTGLAFARYFDGSGPLRGEVLLPIGSGSPIHFELAMDASGRSVVVAGENVGGVLLVNGLPAGGFRPAPPPAPAKPMDDPDVAMSPDGDFLVVWEQRPPDTAIEAVFGQRFTIDLPEDCSGPSAGISITSVQLSGNTPVLTLEGVKPIPS